MHTEDGLLTLIVQNMVNHPAMVVVDRSMDEKGILLRLHVHPEDMGKIIGREGNTAQALRLIMRARGRQKGAIVSVLIAEPDIHSGVGEAGQVR